MHSKEWGRSLWPLLTGADYPQSEFASVYSEKGLGGLHYDVSGMLDLAVEGALSDRSPFGFDELNSWTQSGSMRMVRKGDWKLALDMQGHGNCTTWLPGASVRMIHYRCPDIDTCSNTPSAIGMRVNRLVHRNEPVSHPFKSAGDGGA